MSHKELAQYIGRFSDQRVLVVGDVMLDHYVFGKVERLNPEAPVPVLHAQKELDATGGAGNVAKNAAMVGSPTALITVVGEDATAQRLKEVATKEGYECIGVVDSKRPTIRKTRFLVNSQQLLRVDHEDTQDIDSGLEDALIEQVREHAEGVSAIIISDYAKGVVTQKVAAAILEIGKQKGIMIVADVKSSRAKFVVGASLISPNLKEGYEFLGVNPLEHGQLEPAEVAAQLHTKMKTDVYLTLGAGGVYVKTDSVDTHIPQEHVAQVFDVSGAGDTFIVALTLSLLCGASPQEAAAIANAAGAIVVGKIGSVGLTQAELLAMLEHKHS